MVNYTEIIAKYIAGELSDTDKTTFEKELNSNTELKKEYELQLQIIEGAKRLGLKNQVSSSFKAVKTKKLINKVLIGLAITIATIGAVVLVKKIINKNSSEVLYELNEQGNTNWSEADKRLESQVFKLNPLRDTIIETKNGIVFSIPAKAFLNKQGETPTETIDVEIKEAMTASEIIKAGLSTMSNGKLLETGGMFYVNARVGEENLTIDKSKPLNANVPVNNNKKDMMLFKGERKADGSINWIDPKPLKKRLTTVDITKLNFYPEHFLDSLKNMGFDVKNKKLTDSIYYSFSGYCLTEGGSITRQSAAAQPASPSLTDTTKVAYSFEEAEVYHHELNAFCSEIDPSRVKAIWDKKFNNTILATNEFEERLKVIFTTCNAEILNLYINNLNRPLYQLDSAAASVLNGILKDKFLEFFERGDGGVEISDNQNQQLQKYFEEKRELYAKAVNSALEKMYKEENKKAQIASEEYINHLNTESLRASKVFSEEFELNMDEAYRQLGKQRPTKLPATNYFSASITQTGWNNVDKYVIESTTKRTTLDYTDPESGKKAVIKYEPIMITVNNFKGYDKVMCYMIPDKLSSFQLIKNNGNVFKENLNELIKYSVVIVGFKGNSAYYHVIENAKTQVYSIELASIEQAELDKKLNGSFGLNAGTDLTREINYQLFETKEVARKKQIKDREELRYRLSSAVFPCYKPYVSPEEKLRLEKYAQFQVDSLTRELQKALDAYEN